jgi:hypothetical protein
MDKVKLHDSVIAHVVKLIQLGFITGTDVVDHFRMIEMVAEEGELFLSKEYEAKQEDNITRMLEEASQQSETQQEQ